jgi:phosphate transport system permease protein
MLFLIVGYIVVNGVYTTRSPSSAYLPFPQESIAIGAEGEHTMAIVANPRLQMDSITYEDLREIYLGLTTYWGYLTGQDHDIAAYVYGEESYRRAVSSYLLGPDASIADRVQSVDSPEEMAERVSAQAGAVALVPAQWAASVDGVSTIGLRQINIAVHPGVVALQAGRRLDSITAEQLRSLLNGEAEAWSDVGGPSVEIEPANLAEGIEGEYEPLPVKPLLLSESTPERFRVLDDVVGEMEFTPRAERFDGVDALVDALKNTKGSFALLRASEVRPRELETLEMEFTTGSINLRPSFFVEEPSRAGAVGGVSTIIINTLVMVAFVLAIATPIGVSAAIYLVEYARQGRFVTILRVGTDTLAGVPSIIFGLFGMVFFSQFLGLQTGLLAGSFTLTLMILPTVVRTSEEALRSVPTEIREGSLALGATKLQTIFRTVLPAASPGILTGIILGIGRAVGETAALLFTMGSNLAMVQSLNSPIRVLSVHLYLLIRENISIPNAFATATILVAIIIAVNFTTRQLIGRMNKLSGN